MEYFSSNGLSENLSLHDMIECDIKSEFCERSSTTDDPVLTQAGLDQHPSFHVQQTGQHNLVSDIRNGHFTQEQQQKLSELSWLQTIHGLTSISSLLQPENTDPNLMVNPQTGLPAILQAQGQCRPTEDLISNPQDGLMHTNMSMLQHTNQQPQEHMNFMSTMSPSIPPTPPQRYHQPSSPRATTPSRTMSSNVHYPKSPLISQHLLQTSVANQQPKVTATENSDNGKVYPKPMYSYSCLIAMALKNSDTGALPVSEIYSFMTENFPYFKSAPDGWKNSVRHNLSLNKCFEKIENPKASGSSRKGCLWGLHPAKIEKMEEEITKWRKKDPAAIKRSMAKPEVLEQLEIGQVGSLSPRHPNNIRANSNSATYRSPSVRCIYPPSPTMHTTPTKTASVPVIRMFDVTSKISDQGHMKAKSEDSGFLLEDAAGGLDNCVDPALTDLALQNCLWEDIGTETLNLEDIPFSAACNLSFSNGLIPTSSVLHPNSVTGLSNPSICPQYTGLVCVGGQSTAVPTTVPQSQGSLALSRTILAQT